jgi:protein gp37
MSRTKSSHVRLSEADATGEAWNVLRGCSRASPGCDYCYSERVASQTCATGQPYEGFATKDGWTWKVELVESKLDEPIRSRRTRAFNVASMSDLFHEGLDEDDLVAVFAVMAVAGQHRFMVSTKRADRMQQLLSDPTFARDVKLCRQDVVRGQVPLRFTWPLPNVWLGVSVENQELADLRVPALVATPAALRFVACEPLLGPIDLSEHMAHIRWVIVGSELGRLARPMNLDWVRSLRDQAAGASFFFSHVYEDGAKVSCPELDGVAHVGIPSPY